MKRRTCCCWTQTADRAKFSCELENLNLSYSIIKNTNLTNIDLTGCNLIGITLENIIGTGTLTCIIIK